MKFVSFYDNEMSKDENRVYSPATAAVVDYIARSLNRINKHVEIISPSETRNTKGKYPFSCVDISEGISLTKCATHGYSNKLLRAIDKIKCRLWLVRYLLKNTKENEIVFFWDSPTLYEPLLLYKMFDRKNVKIVYFASEIFQYVLPLGRLKRKMEWRLFNNADMLIVSTELLNNRINPNNVKPSIVLHGTYTLAKKYSKRFNDGLVHIVYAGIINESKGALKAVKIAALLSEKYRMHIIGFGTEDNIEELKRNIDISNENNSCKVSYDGLYLGEKYNEFLQMCDIGLCTQDAKAKYNMSSFPSKILSYMCNGLRVISLDIETIRASCVGDTIFFVKNDSEEEYARVIKLINLNDDYNSREIIKDLDERFVDELEAMICLT